MSRARVARARWSRRTWIAAAVVAATVTSLLLGWYWAGAADASARARLARRRPFDEQQARVTAVAGELRRDLDDVLRRESLRPYYHYSNLFRDPRGASTGLSLSPSPLAAGPSEPLVAEHFQIDAAGVVTLPTINDDVPELSDRARLAAHRRARARLAATAPSLRARVLDPGVAVAAATAIAPAAEPPQASGQAPPQRRAVRPDAPADAPVSPPKLRAKTSVPSQVERLDPDVYAQNAAPAQVYQNIVSQQRLAPVDPPVSAPSQQVRKPLRRDPPQRQASLPPVPKPSSNALRTVEDGRITIVTSPLAWHTISLAARPALVAMREVSTPDGRLVQGLVIDRAALERWLVDREVDHDVRLVLERATRARRADSGSDAEDPPDSDAEVPLGSDAEVPLGSDAEDPLGSGSPAGADASSASSASGAVDPGLVPVAGPWSLAAIPVATSVTAAAARAAAIERGFQLRFLAVAVAATLAGAFVVLLMAGSERLARERSQFAAAAAHELRTPLAGLQLYGDMLADGLGDPGKSRDYARRLSEEAARLGRVVSNVLGFSQLERGNLTLDPRPGDLVEVIRELVARAEPALDRLGVVIELSIPTALPARFDRDAVVRILGNLLDNAEKYGRAAEDRTITVAATSTSTGAQISVRDHGPGIAPHVARRLFRPFARGAGPDGPAGLGLGLALSRSLAEAMGGSLGYQRVEGQTEFALQLPGAPA